MKNPMHPKMTSRSKVMAFDPSLANWGWVLFHSDGTFIESGVIQIKPSDQDKSLTKVQQDMQRAEALRQAVANLLKDKHPYVVVAETPIGGRDSRAAFAYAVVASVLGFVKAKYKNNMVCYTPLRTKKQIKANASKTEVIRWADTYYPYALARNNKGEILLGKSEHIADALLAYNLWKTKYGNTED